MNPAIGYVKRTMKVFGWLYTQRYIVLAVAIVIIQEQAMLYAMTGKLNWAFIALYYAVDIPFFFLVSYYAVPFALKRPILLRIVTSVFISFSSYILMQNIVDFLVALSHPHASTYTFELKTKASILRGSYLSMLATGYYLSREGIKKMVKTKNLEIEKLELETAYLRSKIKPHLIFNTLNYIYGLVEEASEEVANIRLKKALKSTKLFSKVLRYALNNENEKVSLKQELEHVYHYIGLNRERLGKQLCFELNLDIDGQIDTIQIPPLILITFVENVFMHGDLYNKDHPCQLSIQYYNQQLYFGTWNLKKSAAKLESTGVGMAYIRNQLSRNYTGRYSLSINDTDNFYELLFTIEL